MINAIQTTTPTINQNIAFNNIQAIDPNIEATKQQNLQIQNIANDLLKVGHFKKLINKNEIF